MVDGEVAVRVPGGDESLARVVERQRHENDGLRAALRYRAVIEQAKGILMARTGMDPETAFRHLVGHSQRTNLKLTQVAAAVVAHTMTRRPAGRGSLPTDAQILHEATSDDALQRLAASAVAAAPDFTELMATVVQHTSELGVRGGMLAVAEPDGALRLVAWQGLETHEVSGWQRIPPGSDMPVCRAAEDRAPVWLGDRRERLRRFPGSARFTGHREACAALPLVLDRQLIGCLSLDWDVPRDLDATTREHLVSVAELCAAPVAMLLRRHDEPLPELDLEPGYARWFRAFLDSMPAAMVLLEPELDGEHLADLTVRFLNRAASAHPGLVVGTSLLESQPELASGAFLDEARKALRTGAPVRGTQLALQAPAGDLLLHFDDVNLVRIGSLLALTWRPPDG